MPDEIAERVLALARGPGRLAELVVAMRGLTDKQRKTLSGPVRALTLEGGYDRDRTGFVLAVLGCVNGVRQVATALTWISLPREAEALAVQVLVDRRPHWLAELPAALLVGDNAQPWGFRLVRRLVRDGLVERPDFPDYYLRMPSGLSVSASSAGTDRAPLDDLKADPDLIQHEIWSMLRTEGAGRELAAHDTWRLQSWTGASGSSTLARPELTWRHALLTLVADGTVDRDRVLDETLGAFLRDWTPGDLGWYIALHDELAPTLQELDVRQGTYARLLAAAAGPAVTLALRAFTQLLRAGRLEIDTLLAAAHPVLLRPDKGPVVAMLKLLAGVAKASPDRSEAVAAAAAWALEHERADVQERTLTLLGNLVPDAGVRTALVSGHAERMAPSVRPMASAESAGRASEAPILIQLPAPPLDPVADVDELAELFTRLIEEADDPADVERLLEGVARLARARPRHGAEVLARRADELVGSYQPGPWSGEEPRADLAALALVWLERRKPGKGYPGRPYGAYVQRMGSWGRQVRSDWSLAALVTMRTHEVARAVAGGGASLLSLPTSRDGALAAAALSARVAAMSRTERPLPLDIGLAALRVAPAEYDAVQLPARHRTGRELSADFGVLRSYAPCWELVVGRSKDTDWSAYERAATWQDRASPRGKADDAVRAVLDRRDPLPSLAGEAADGDYASRFDQVAALWPLLLPHHPDLLAAHAHARLNRGLAKNRSGTEPLLDALAASRQRTGRPTCSALLLGLAAKNGVERTRAVDALLDLAGRDLLDGPVLGDTLAALLTADVVVGSRVAPGFHEAARTDLRAATAVLDALVAALPVLPDRKDAHLFVDLLAQLAVEQGRAVSLPEPFRQAAASSASSVLARACRRVPQP